MNRHFLIEGGRSDFPAISYARLEQTEPIDLAEAKEAVFGFEAVDAAWSAFAPGAAFDLRRPDFIRLSQHRFWEASRHGRTTEGPAPANPFEEAPIYRIEVTLRRPDLLFHTLAALGDEWVEIRLTPPGSGGVAVDVFAGLFFEPTLAALVSLRPAEYSVALEAAFSLDAWSDATDTEIEGELTGLPNIAELAVFDVGQGSANALLDGSGTPQAWHDLGCGVYRNKFTLPPGALRFCGCSSPPIIMSHWDSDHWSGARQDTRALSRTWIAPRQTIGPKHKAFASDILAAHGQILIVGHGAGPFQTTTSSGQALHLQRASGTGRNASGLVLIVDDPASGRAWMLTGDAGYNYISLPWSLDFAAIVVPHHGADMGAASIPPARPTSSSYARLAYSFGPGNKHGSTSISHPTNAAMNAHASMNWSHGAWMRSGPGLAVAGVDTLATAENPTTHLDGAVLGWGSAPNGPFVIPCCLPGGCLTPLRQT